MLNITTNATDGTGSIATNSGTNQRIGCPEDKLEMRSEGNTCGAGSIGSGESEADKAIIDAAPLSLQTHLKKPHLREAYLFARKFPLKTGVEYGWVLQIAKSQHATSLKHYDDLDTKASVLIGYFIGGAGALMAGLFTAVATGSIGQWSGGLGIIPFGFMIAAVIYALRARKVSVLYTPSPSLAVTYANQCNKYAEGSFSGEWYFAAILTEESNREKAIDIHRASALAKWAIITLTIPFLFALFLPVGKSDNKPITVHIAHDPVLPIPPAKD